MCGIIGYVGSKNIKEVLIKGLKRVEYRGYDSSGIAFFDDGIKIIKAKGKISNLEEKLSNVNIDGNIGIAHTRWATHGEPSETNAHPHGDNDLSVVIAHNGIIENYQSLKELLIKKGHIFKSETDSEILAHLISEYLNGDPIEAVRSALREVKGAYGVAVLFKKYPNIIVFAKKGSPLSLGIGENEYFIASDAASFREFTNKRIILEDNQIGFISKDTYKIFDLENIPVSSKVETIEWELENIEKEGYKYFMEKEIMNQGESLKNSLRGRIDDNGNIKLGGLGNNIDLLKSQKGFFFVAAGTSLHAGRIGKVLFEEIADLPSQWENASELANQDRPIFRGNTGVFVISQSGETADLIIAMERLKQLNIPIFGICNVVGSTIANKSDSGIYIHAGPEIGVASTKAFTSQVLILNLIALFLKQIKNIENNNIDKKYIEDLKNIPSIVENTLKIRESVEKIAEKYYKYKNFLFLGRGINLPTALEGALKLKEVSYIHAEGYSTGEMKHGPLAMIDENFPSVFIVPRHDKFYNKIISNIQEIKARKGPVIAIANEGDTEIAKYVDDVIYVPEINYYLTPIIFAIPLQLFAYHVAIKLGRNVDQPRNLAKSVTVE